MKDEHFIVPVVALTALQCMLVLAGVVPPLLAEFPIAAFFSIVRIGIVVYQGWTLAGYGLKTAAMKGGLTMLSAVIVICLFVFIGRYLHQPVLGVPVASSLDLLIILICLIVANTLLGAVLAAAAAWSSAGFGKKK